MQYDGWLPLQNMASREPVNCDVCGKAIRSSKLRNLKQELLAYHCCGCKCYIHQKCLPDVIRVCVAVKVVFELNQTVACPCFCPGSLVLQQGSCLCYIHVRFCSVHASLCHSFSFFYLVSFITLDFGFTSPSFLPSVRGWVEDVHDRVHHRYLPYQRPVGPALQVRRL